MSRCCLCGKHEDQEDMTRRYDDEPICDDCVSLVEKRWDEDDDGFVGRMVSDD